MVFIFKGMLAAIHGISLFFIFQSENEFFIMFERIYENIDAKGENAEDKHYGCKLNGTIFSCPTYPHETDVYLVRQISTGINQDDQTKTYCDGDIIFEPLRKIVIFLIKI